MGPNILIKVLAEFRKSNEMLKIPQTCDTKVRITTGFQPSIEPASPRPFVNPAVFSPIPLRPIMKQGNWSGMDNAHGRQIAEQPCISEEYLPKLFIGKPSRIYRVVWVSEIIFGGKKSDRMISGMIR